MQMRTFSLLMKIHHFNPIFLSLFSNRIYQPTRILVRSIPSTMKGHLLNFLSKSENTQVREN